MSMPPHKPVANLIGRLFCAGAMAAGTLGMGMSSVSAQRGGGILGGPHYSAAKAGVLGLAKAMARDLAKDGIRLVSVAPGSVLFPGGGWDRRQKADPEGIAAFVAREIPCGRFGRPEEFAALVAHIVENEMLNAEVIRLDGALRMPPR